MYEPCTWSSGGSAGRLVIRRTLVRIPGCMLKCPWARCWTLNCSWLAPCMAAIKITVAVEMQVQLPQNRVWMFNVLQLPSRLCCSSGWINLTSFSGVMTVAANAALSHRPQAEVQRWGAGETDSILSNSTPPHCLFFFFRPQIQLMSTQVTSPETRCHTLCSSHWAYKKCSIQLFFHTCSTL